MFYGIFSMVCLLIGLFLLGQGIELDKIKIAIPGMILLLIGFVNGFIWLLETIITI